MQMCLVQDDDMVEALSTRGANEPFDIGILPRRAIGNQHLLDAHVLDPLFEMLRINRVSVTNQIPRRSIVWERFDHLLCGPLLRGMFGDIEVDRSAPVVTQYN